jgi:hypothetical protein
MNIKTKGQVTRLRVFNYLKRVMDKEGRVPTGEEVGSVIDISPRMAQIHMRALDGADGLSMRIPNSAERCAARNATHMRQYGALGAAKKGYNVDYNLLPLDVLIEQGVM